MAHLRKAPRSRQYQHRAAAAESARAEPNRKHLAVHARQLALQPRVHIRRGHRRSLLRRLEQARRAALAHHVYRSTRLGAWVLISAAWYNTCLIKQLERGLVLTKAICGFSSPG